MDAVEAVADAGSMEEIVDQITDGIDKARTNKRVYAKLAKKPPRGVDPQPPPSELGRWSARTRRRSQVGRDQSRGENGGGP